MTDSGLCFPDLDADDGAVAADDDDDGGPEVDLLQLAVSGHPADGLHHATGETKFIVPRLGQSGREAQVYYRVFPEWSSRAEFESQSR